LSNQRNTDALTGNTEHLLFAIYNLLFVALVTEGASLTRARFLKHRVIPLLNRTFDSPGYFLWREKIIQTDLMAQLPGFRSWGKPVLAGAKRRHDES